MKINKNCIFGSITCDCGGVFLPGQSCPMCGTKYENYEHNQKNITHVIYVPVICPDNSRGQR